MNTLPDTAAAMLAVMRARAIEASPFTRWTNTELLRCWAGEAELTVPIRPDLTQHRGTVHGAILGMAADNVCCWAAASLLGALVTGNYTIHFVAPARGTRIRAFGKVAHAGRRSAVVGAEIYSEDAAGKVLVATALASVVSVRPADDDR